MRRRLSPSRRACAARSAQPEWRETCHAGSAPGATVGAGWALRIPGPWLDLPTSTTEATPRAEERRHGLTLRERGPSPLRAADADAPTPPSAGCRAPRKRALGNEEGESGLPSSGAHGTRSPLLRPLGTAAGRTSARAQRRRKVPTSNGNLSGGYSLPVAKPLAHDSYLVDSASSHMLVSKIKPCMSKYKQLYSETANGSLYKLSFI